MKTSVLGGLLLCGLVACGGGTKGGKTTPGQGSADQSMKDPGDPTGGGVATGSGANPGGGAPTGGGAPLPPGGGGPGVPDAPVVPPNLDKDPAIAKQAVDAHLTIARNALSANPPDGETALKEARLALAEDAASVEAATYVAFAYYHKKLFDTAELVLDDLFKRDAAKTNANVYYVYGLIYDRTNRPERAEVAFKKAVELDGRHASALVNLGVHQLKNSQYADAQATFERLTKEFNRVDVVTLTSLGSAYRGRSADYPAGAAERDQFVRTAEAAYKRALQTNANYGPAYYNLGLLYLDTDPYPGVVDPLQRLSTAKSYFDMYKGKADYDIKLYESRSKDVDKAIKRAQKKAKQNSKKPAGKP